MIELYVAVVGVAGAIGGSIVTHFLARKRNAADIGGVLSTAGAELARSAMEQVKAMDGRLATAEKHVDECNADRRKLRSAMNDVIAAVKAGHAEAKARAIASAELAMLD